MNFSFWQLEQFERVFEIIYYFDVFMCEVFVLRLDFIEVRVQVIVFMVNGNEIGNLFMKVRGC